MGQIRKTRFHRGVRFSRDQSTFWPIEVRCARTDQVLLDCGAVYQLRPKCLGDVDAQMSLMVGEWDGVEVGRVMVSIDYPGYDNFSIKTKRLIWGKGNAVALAAEWVIALRAGTFDPFVAQTLRFFEELRLAHITEK